MVNRPSLVQPYANHLHVLAQQLDFSRQEVLHLEPDIKEKFSCSACAECCQRPWMVSVTQDYYEQWNPIFESHPSGRFKGALLAYNNPHSEKYAELQRKPGTHECVFLDDDRMCFLQKEYGPAALSSTCQLYPRYNFWQGSSMGSYLRTGCPDVAELIQEPIQLYYLRVKLADKAWEQGMLHKHPLGMIEGYSWLGMTLDIVEDTRFTAVENMLRLGQVLRWTHAQSQVTSEQLLAVSAQARRGDLPYRKRYAPEQGYQLLRRFSVMLPLVQKYLRQIYQRACPFPQLNDQERELLRHFTSRFLFYGCLNLHLKQDNVERDFYTYYFYLALQLIYMQWLAMYYRFRARDELNFHHLARAMAQVGYRFENGAKIAQKLELDPIDIPVLLEMMDALLSHDFSEVKAAA